MRCLEPTESFQKCHRQMTVVKFDVDVIDNPARPLSPPLAQPSSTEAFRHKAACTRVWLFDCLIDERETYKCGKTVLKRSVSYPCSFCRY
jgi:hypothetical protein